jgi:putative hydrolase of the HAD superfamily
MIQGVIFDLDHTLFDRYATFKKALPEFYNRYKDKIPSHLSVEEFIDQLTQVEKRYIHYGWTEVIKRCCEAGLFSSFSSQETEEAVDFIMDSCWPLAAVEYPFTKPTLIKLREEGYKLGLITNGKHHQQDLKIEMLGIRELFHEIIICGDVGVQKPHIEPFLLMSEKIGIPPHRLLYVGDNPINDVEGSRNAGYIPVWVKTTGYWCHDIVPAEYAVDTVEEIPKLIKEIHNKKTV